MLPRSKALPSANYTTLANLVKPQQPSACGTKIRVNGELVVSPGLVARRAAEAAMFRNVHRRLHAAGSRTTAPLAQSRAGGGTVTAATGTVATVGAGVQAVSDLKT